MTSLRMTLGVSGVLLLSTPVFPQSADATVQRIRTDYADVQRALPTLRVVRRNLNDEASEGGTVVGYYTKANVLRALTITFFGETGKRVDEVYLLPGDRRFVLRSVMRYDKPFGKVVETRQSRFYLTGSKLVRRLEGTKQVPAGNTESSKLAGQLQKDIERYRTILTQPDPYQ